MVVQQYGDQIIEMLLAQVIVICSQVGYAHKVWFLLFSGGDKLGFLVCRAWIQCLVSIQLSEGFYFVVQMNPGQVCQKIGLCQFAADARYLANFLTLLSLLFGVP